MLYMCLRLRRTSDTKDLPSVSNRWRETAHGEEVEVLALDDAARDLEHHHLRSSERER